MVYHKVRSQTLYLSYYISTIYTLQSSLLRLTILLMIPTYLISRNRQNFFVKEVNADLKILTCQLNVNKISLNANKTEVIIFHSQSRPLNYQPCLKILGQRCCILITSDLIDQIRIKRESPSQSCMLLVKLLAYIFSLSQHKTKI